LAYLRRKSLHNQYGSVDKREEENDMAQVRQEQSDSLEHATKNVFDYLGKEMEYGALHEAVNGLQNEVFELLQQGGMKEVKAAFSASKGLHQPGSELESIDNAFGATGPALIRNNRTGDEVVVETDGTIETTKHGRPPAHDETQLWPPE
jgi:hypothetical protein